MTENQESTMTNQKKTGTIIAVIALLVILTGIVLGIIALAQPTTDTGKVRDIFIIVLAVESLLLGVALVILVVQLAVLTNLVQNEVKPILESTNETVSNLRGTTTFLGDNLVEPVIKLNEYIAGLTQFIQVIGLARGKPKNKKQGE